MNDSAIPPWKMLRLGDVASKIQDGTHFSPASSDGPFRYLTSRNVRFGHIDLADSGWVSESEHRAIYRRCDPQRGDLLLTKDGANTGNAAINTLDEQFSLLSSVAMLRFNTDEHVPSFYLQYLLSPRGQGQLKSQMSGNAITRLTLTKIKNFIVPVPPLREQRRIAEILGSVDEAIRSTERLIAKLGQAKRGLLHDLLTCGIDGRGQLRDPCNNPQAFLETPIGLFPQAWKVALLGDVVTKGEYGISLPLAYGPGIPVLRMNNIHDGEIVRDDIKSCSLPIPSQLLLKPGDVLFNRTNSMEHVGRTGIWRGGGGKFSFASYLVRLVHNPTVMLPQYLNMWLNYSDTQLNLRKYATPGVHQVNINPPNLRRIPIAYPPSISEQSAICERVEAADAELAQLRRELHQRSLLKQGLMDDLLTGRVRVGALA